MNLTIFRALYQAWIETFGGFACTSNASVRSTFFLSAPKVSVVVVESFVNFYCNYRRPELISVRWLFFVVAGSVELFRGVLSRKTVCS